MQLKGLRVVFGCDHAGWTLKKQLLDLLKEKGAEVKDLGCNNPDERVDYPDYASLAGRAVADGRADLGVLACGTGIGMSIAANKIKGVRAAVVWDDASAALAKEHNQANVICFGGRHFESAGAAAALKAFLEAKPSEEPRHINRLTKISAIEKKGC